MHNKIKINICLLLACVCPLASQAASHIEISFAPFNNIIPPRSDYKETTLAIFQSDSEIVGLSKSDIVVSNGIALKWRKRNPKLYDLQVQSTNTSGFVSVTIPAGSCSDSTGTPLQSNITARLPIAWAPWAIDVKRSHYIVRERWAPQASIGLSSPGQSEEAMMFTWISPGSFDMGNASTYDEPIRSTNTSPHHVSISKGFWIASSECTQKQWMAVMTNNPAFFTYNNKDTDKHPVDSVSWTDVNKFISNVNRAHNNLHMRLPTEAEWEFACRAETTTAFFSGPDDIKGDASSKHLEVIGWFAGNSANWKNGKDSEKPPSNAINIASSFSSILYGPPKYTKFAPHKISNHAKNDWALKDTSGNLAEWCIDSYTPSLGTNSVVDPVTTNNSPLKVIRGGSWRSSAAECRSYARAYLDKNTKQDDVGFRPIIIPAN